MLFVFVGYDKPGALQLRLDTRPVHLDYLGRLNAEGKLKFAGPFLGEDGKPVGSLVAVEAPDIAAAQAMVAADPYAQAGLFDRVDVKAWNWVFNNPAA